MCGPFGKVAPRSTDVGSWSRIMGDGIRPGHGFEKTDKTELTGGGVTVTQKKVEHPKTLSAKQKTRLPTTGGKTESGGVKTPGLRSNSLITEPKVSKKIMKAVKKGAMVMTGARKANTLNVSARVSFAREVAGNPRLLTAATLLRPAKAGLLGEGLEGLLQDAAAVHAELVKLDPAEAAKFRRDMLQVGARLGELQAEVLSEELKTAVGTDSGLGIMRDMFMRKSDAFDVALGKMKFLFDGARSADVVADAKRFVADPENGALLEKCATSCGFVEDGPNKGRFTYQAYLTPDEAKRMNVTGEPVSEGAEKGKLNCNVLMDANTFFTPGEVKKYSDYFSGLMDKLVDSRNFSDDLLKMLGDRCRLMEEINIDPKIVKSTVPQEAVKGAPARFAFAAIVNDVGLRYLTGAIADAPDPTLKRLAQTMFNVVSNNPKGTPEEIKTAFYEMNCNRCSPHYNVFDNLLPAFKEKIDAIVKKCLELSDNYLEI